MYEDEFFPDDTDPAPGDTGNGAIVIPDYGANVIGTRDNSGNLIQSYPRVTSEDLSDDPETETLSTPGAGTGNAPSGEDWWSRLTNAFDQTAGNALNAANVRLNSEINKSSGNANNKPASSATATAGKMSAGAIIFLLVAGAVLAGVIFKFFRR